MVRTKLKTCLNLGDGWGAGFCQDISAMATPPGHPDLRITLAKTANYIADLTSAIENESPVAELTHLGSPESGCVARFGGSLTSARQA
jgi:hypothetical protein